MGIEEFDLLLKEKIGINCFVVRMCDDTCSHAIVSDGTYEFKIKVSKLSNTKLLGIHSMTTESRIKKINEYCTNNVIVIDIFRHKTNLTVKLLHTPTGHIEQRNANTKKLSQFCKTIESNANREKRFIERCSLKFGDNITYEKTKYIGSEIKTIITCKIHGDFQITPNRFEQTVYGCPNCGKENRPLYTKSSFVNKCDFRIGYIYVIECWSDDERFIKIGITRYSNLNRRFYKGGNMPYEYSVLMAIGYDPSNIFDFEIESHRKFKSYRYKPKMNFHGRTECFDISIKDEAICFIQKLLLNCTSQI